MYNLELKTGKVTFYLHKQYSPLDYLYKFILYVQPEGGPIQELGLAISEYTLEYMTQDGIRELLFSEFSFKLADELAKPLSLFLSKVGKDDKQVQDTIYYIKNSVKTAVSHKNNYRQPEVDKLPGMRRKVKHPVTGEVKYLENVIINLNDRCGWTRDQIADWLETLDIDLRFREDGQYDSDEDEPVEKNPCSDLALKEVTVKIDFDAVSSEALKLYFGDVITVEDWKKEAQK